MPAYTIILVEGFSKKLLMSPARKMLGPILDGLIEKIKANPRGYGGSYSGHWAYQLGRHKIMAEIDDKVKTVTFVELVSL